MSNGVDEVVRILVFASMTSFRLLVSSRQHIEGAFCITAAVEELFLTGASVSHYKMAKSYLQRPASFGA